MQNWFKCGVLALIMIGTAAPAFSGGIDNKQNFSGAYAGSLSRNAATDGADIAAYNPAGIMVLKNGIHLQFDLQPFHFDYDHNYNGSTQTASTTSVIPTAFGIYKQQKWAAWGAFTVNGGGGELEYEHGNSITQQIKSLSIADISGGMIPGGMGGFSALANTLFWKDQKGIIVPNPSVGINAGGSFSNEYAYAESYDYTFTAGMSYKINDIFSVAGGLRYVFTDKDVDIHGIYTQGGTTTDVIGVYTQDAQGFGGVFGINIRPNDTLNFGIRYETQVNLDWDTRVGKKSKGTVGENILAVNERIDGKSVARDLPAVLGLGLEWKFTPKLTFKPSFTYFFEKEADWGNQNHAVDSNGYEVGMALQYDINETWSLTTGYLYIDVDMKPENYKIIEKMSPPLDCHAVAMGGQYRMSEQLSFTFGLASYFYKADTAPATTFSPEVTYDKIFYQVGIGIQYSIF